LRRFIGGGGEELDMSGIYAVCDGRDSRGRLGYDRLMLTRLHLNGYGTGMRSSRQIEKATHDDIDFRNQRAAKTRITLRLPHFGSIIWT